METFISFLHIIFITIFCSWYWKKQQLPVRKFYWHALGAKLSAGILLGIIHVILYTSSDTFFFFDSAVEASRQARMDFPSYLNFLSGQSGGYFLGIDRTIFFVKITSIFALITYDNYWICTLYFSLFSFLAAWKLTKEIWLNFPGVGIPAAIAFLFFPSCVFWASGIIKESLAMTGFYILSTFFLQFWLRRKISFTKILLSLICIWMVWNVKYYYIGLFIPVLLATWIARVIIERRHINKFSSEVSIWFSILIFMVLAATFTHPNFSLQKILDVLVSNNLAYMKASNPDDIIHFHNLKSSWLAIGMNSPWALISGLFRPFAWEANTLLKFASSMENLVMMVLVILSLMHLSEIKKSPHRLLILAIVIYCLMLCVFLAISTPNFGTLVRYRIGFLPFLLVLLINQPFIVKALSKTFNVQMPDLPR
jgi:hypothetical protein